jgi:DNA-binding XRE family transcriptional regulator
MNPIQAMSRDLRKRFPGATITIDRSGTETGSWWLDAFQRGRKVVIEWRANRGFGVSTPTVDDYGEGPHEIYTTSAEALNRVVALLSSSEQTKAPRELVLKSLREERQLSQEQLAKLLRVRQASISKLERRADVRVSTLRSIVAGMGGRLELRAIFPKNVIRIVQFDDSKDSLRKTRARKGGLTKR